MFRMLFLMILSIFVFATCAPLPGYETGDVEGDVEVDEEDPEPDEGEDPVPRDDAGVGPDPDRQPDADQEGDADGDFDVEGDMERFEETDADGDEDADSDHDEDDDYEPVRECEEGETRTCGTDIGACELGVRYCLDGVWGPCVDSVGPEVEICNDIDDDCDGEIDEGANPCGGVCSLSNPPGRACDGADRDLCMDDVYECTGPNATRCSRGDDNIETCNDLDDDCDGLVDEEEVCEPDCTDECSTAGVSVSGSTYWHCELWGDEDPCLDRMGPYECLSDSGGVCGSPRCPFAAPRPVSPADSALVAPGSATLCWSSVGGADLSGYNVSLSTRTSRLSAHRDRGAYCIPAAEWSSVYQRGSSTSTCRTFSLSLGSGDIVYWQVQACSWTECGPWSIAYRLEVR